MSDTIPPMIDPFGREIRYLRLSVTDRCDLRCAYCMSERMTFLPREELLSIEELDRLASAFVSLGVTKLRVTGGEPLVRRGILDFFSRMSRHLQSGALEELTCTTNGTQLAHHADQLVECGVRRINISLDTIDAARYCQITRGGNISSVLTGIERAKAVGLRIKINAVALADDTEGLFSLVEWAHAEGFDVSLIETMPLGDTGTDRASQYLSLLEWKALAASRWKFIDLQDRTGGPSRYVQVEETGGRLGFITPMSDNFCNGCNRVRITCTGMFYPCLGQEQKVDFRQLLRAGVDDVLLLAAIRDAIAHKPKAHDFRIVSGSLPTLERHMSVTGG